MVKENLEDKMSKLIDREDIKNEIKNECMMCYQKAPNTIFQPCGHGGVCFDCSIEIMKNGNIECHFCRGVKYFLILIANQ